MDKSTNTARLQDIDAWIRLVEAEKQKGIIYRVGNRLACPFMAFKSTNEWLDILNFERKQEIERIEFF